MLELLENAWILVCCFQGLNSAWILNKADIVTAVLAKKINSFILAQPLYRVDAHFSYRQVRHYETWFPLQSSSLCRTLLWNITLVAYITKTSDSMWWSGIIIISVFMYCVYVIYHRCKGLESLKVPLENAWTQRWTICRNTVNCLHCVSNAWFTQTSLYQNPT